MPTSNTFPACCGVNIISGFPYDDDGDWAMRELSNMPKDMKKAEGSYCHCHLVALTPDQISSAEVIKTLGYVEIGTFKSCDGPYKVTLYGRGLTLTPLPEPPEIKKPKAKKKATRRSSIKKN